MCQRFIEDFTNKVVERMKEPSTFYLFGCEESDDSLYKVMSFNSRKCDLSHEFIQNFKQINVHVKINIIHSLSYFLDITTVCECEDCLYDYKSSQKDDQRTREEDLVPYEIYAKRCQYYNLECEMISNLEKLEEKAISCLKTIDIMDIDKYTNNHYFIVEDTTGAVEKMCKFIKTDYLFL